MLQPLVKERDVRVCGRPEDVLELVHVERGVEGGCGDGNVLLWGTDINYRMKQFIPKRSFSNKT